MSVSDDEVDCPGDVPNVLPQPDDSDDVDCCGGVPLASRCMSPAKRCLASCDLAWHVPAWLVAHPTAALVAAFPTAAHFSPGVFATGDFRIGFCFAERGVGVIPVVSVAALRMRVDNRPRLR